MFERFDLEGEVEIVYYSTIVKQREIDRDAQVYLFNHCRQQLTNLTSSIQEGGFFRLLA